MTSNEIAYASTNALIERENLLRSRASGLASFDEGYDEMWSEIDEIRDQLVGRAHDLEDPSSGLGLHQPT